MIRVLALLAAVLAAAFAVQGSSATFTATASNPGASFATAAKFAPAVTLTAPANGSATNDTTPTLSGAAGNMTGDSTTVTVRIYSGFTATGTVLQTRTATRSGATWTTTATALAVGTYTAQATQTDTSGNTGTSTANTFTIDTTKPAAANIAAANKTGGTAGKIENGDTLTFTYSEPITAASVWSGWNGSSTPVNVTFTNSGTADTMTVTTATTGTVTLGTVATKGNYVSATTTFASTMVRSADGASIVVTLGTPARVVANAVTAKNMTWTQVVGITDLAGNISTTATAYTETDTDVDF